MSGLTVCYLCGCGDHAKRDGRVRDKVELEILECRNCGLVYLSDTSHIHEGFYANSLMRDELCDIQCILKDTYEDSRRRVEYLKNRLINADILDFGAGAGGFALMAKDLAKSVSVIEPEKRFENHYKENQINYFKMLDDLKDNRFDIITAFHVIEHLIDPVEELRKLSDRLAPNGKLVIETPNSEDALLKLYRSKAFSEFTYWSCHLYLFNINTIDVLAKKAGLQTIFIKHVQRYPLANHLYWFSHGKPGGHKEWGGIFDQAVNQQYEAALASIGMTDTIIGIFQIRDLNHD